MKVQELAEPAQGLLPAGASRAESALALALAVERVADGRAVEAVLDAVARPDRPTVVAFINAHAFNLAWKDADFRAALCGSDFLLRDGAGMAILYRMLGLDPGANLNGTDLIPKLLDRFAGRPVALLGTAEPWLSAAAEWARVRGAHIAATADGFLPPDAYLPIIRQAGADLVILGQGMPRQEQVARLLASSLDRPCLIVAGGAILDFWAGRFPRAPRWMRVTGSEWLYRLVCEPARLWRRYVLGNPMFLIRAARLRRRAHAKARSA